MRPRERRGRGRALRGKALIRLGTALATLVALLARGAVAASIRPPALDAGWYPSSRAGAAAVAHYLKRQSREAPGLPGRPLALVLPHAGWAFSGLAAAAALRDLREGDYDRVVVLAPLHAGGFEGFAIEDVSAYRTPLGDVPLCPEAIGLRPSASGRPEAEATAREHAVEVLLPLLQTALGRFCLVPVLLGNTREDHEEALAGRLAALHDGRTLFVASSDFVHYGQRYAFTPFGPTLQEAAARLHALDARAVELVAAKDAAGLRSFFAETGHNACGGRALLVLLELLSLISPEARATLIARYASSDLPLVRDESSVGYAALAFTRDAPPGPPKPPLGPSPPLPAVAPEAWRVGDEVGGRLRRVARAALETELLGGSALGEALAALGDPPELGRRQAVFVSLYREAPPGTPSQQRLRGCRGQGQAQLPLDLAVVEAALQAALYDQRFPRVRPEELGRLEMEVSVLSPLRAVDSPADFRLGWDGLVLARDGKGALFLPQVWKEAGWSAEEALGQLSVKAELPRDAWRGARLLAFETQAFAEGRSGAGVP